MFFEIVLNSFMHLGHIMWVIAGKKLLSTALTDIPGSMKVNGQTDGGTDNITLTADAGYNEEGNFYLHYTEITLKSFRYSDS